MDGAADDISLTPSFPSEHNAFADALHFALRLDTNKVPGEIKKAWQVMEEEAVAKNNPSRLHQQEPEAAR